jgi:predicted helicase
MVKSADYLLHKHFGKTLADKNVDILDPATGTGTFICEVMEHAIPRSQLEYKYKNEIHANEVAILPYYIANLNVEFTYKQKMGQYSEFPNLCFVDTLDNVSGLEAGIGADMLRYKRQDSLFAITSENSERIKRQNARKISVIIGNPPYNANQLNENENNKNREYPFIDKRIKETYIKHSTAQKTKVYDMYARFYRWAMDRVDKNGVIALITNRSFIDSRTFDGFRRCVQDGFSHCCIIDTRSDVRANPKIAGTTHNVFGIQTGVAIMFLIKKEKQEGPCQIEYFTMDDYWRKEEKLDWLKNNAIENIRFEPVHPDKTNNWINLAEESDWEAMVDVKGIFSLKSNGVATGRDEWVYDLNENNLKNKIIPFFEIYSGNLKNDEYDLKIKWTETLKAYHKRKQLMFYNADKIVGSNYRPFYKQFYYSEKGLSDRLTSNHFEINGNDLRKTNKTIVFTGTSSQKPFLVLIAEMTVDWHFVGAACSSICLPLYRYSSTGERLDNITDWGLEQFQAHYSDKKITKEDIFHYTYAVLHNPAYRKKYELNLKREFPRLPFYSDFWKWAGWGKKLMDFHINYETVEPFALELIETETKAAAKRERELISEVSEPQALYKREVRIKAKLKADKEKGIIELDELSFLKGIPKEAWEYKLGNRSALEWILDQYKEKKPKDPTIAEKFNTYRFADYKEKVIDLLRRVTTVSIETMKIVGEMGGE